MRGSDPIARTQQRKLSSSCCWAQAFVLRVGACAQQQEEDRARARSRREWSRCKERDGQSPARLLAAKRPEGTGSRSSTGRGPPPSPAEREGRRPSGWFDVPPGRRKSKGGAVISRLRAGMNALRGPPAAEALLRRWVRAIGSLPLPLRSEDEGLQPVQAKHRDTWVGFRKGERAHGGRQPPWASSGAGGPEKISRSVSDGATPGGSQVARRSCATWRGVAPLASYQPPRLP